MKILTINGWLGREEQWIWRHIGDPEARFDYLGREMWVNYRMTPMNRLLRYDASMFFLGLRAIVRMRGYDAVVCSHLSFGAPLGFMRGVFHIRKPPQYVVTFILHDNMKNRIPFLRVALSGMAGVICHSRKEAENYPKVLNTDPALFTFIPFGVDTTLLRPSSSENRGEYILALGQESRDYRTFFEAIRDLPYPVVVIASAAAVDGLEIPPSVTLHTWMSFKEFIRTVEGARCVVVPLEPTEYSSGQQAFLSAMALGKAVIVTETTGSVDYIEDNASGFLVPPRDVACMRQRIIDLMQDREAVLRVGKGGRKRVEEEFNEAVMSRRVYDLVRTETDRGR